MLWSLCIFEKTEAPKFSYAGSRKVGKIILDKEEISKVVEIEVEMINFCFNISSQLGKKAVLNAIVEFKNFMSVRSGFFAPFDSRYRSFIIELLKGIDTTFVEYATEVVLLGEKVCDETS